jgi:hypothetical protein
LYSTRCLIEHALQDESILDDEKKYIREYGSPILDMFADFTIERNVLHLAPELWKLPAIQKAYLERNRLFHIPEIAYWMEDVNRVLSNSFVPSVADVMRSRVKTTGIVYSTFNENNYEVQLIDVGSERNERKKWYSCFDDVTDLMYVVALDEYPMLCYEDNETNRLMESLACWIEVANAHFFSPSSVNIFLVFNKADLFKQKIESGCDLATYFPSYTGGGADCSKALAFIIDMFLKRIRDKRKVHICVTNALDLDCMKRFWKCVLSVPTLQLQDHMSSKYSTVEDFTLKEEWCWNIKYESSSCLKSSKNNSNMDAEDGSAHYDHNESSCCTFPIAYTDTCNIERLSIGFHSDISLVTKERPNIELKVHSFVLSVRCPKFFKLIMNTKLKNEGLRKIESASFRNVSYGVIPLDFIHHNTLKHILSLIYNNSFYAYIQAAQVTATATATATTTSDQKTEIELICQMNREYEFSEKSEGELMEMYQKLGQNAQDTRVIVYEDRSPLKRFSVAIKKQLKIRKKKFRRNKKKKNKNNNDNNSYNTIPPVPCDTSSSGSSSAGTSDRVRSTIFDSTPILETTNRSNDLSIALLQLNNHEKKYNYDLRMYGCDPQDGSTIKAHKFICHEYLPNYNSDSDSHVVYPFFNFKSYLHALSYMYSGGAGGEYFESAISGSMDLTDIVHAMHISRLWNFDRDDTFFKSLLLKLSKILTVDNICSVLNEFQYDSIHFASYMVCTYNKKTSMFFNDTLLHKLPVEIHLFIYSYLAVPPVMEQQSLEGNEQLLDLEEEQEQEPIQQPPPSPSPSQPSTTTTTTSTRREYNDIRLLNQDSLVYMLFTSEDFICHLQQYYPDYLYVKTETMSAYSSVRHVCHEFIATNFKQIQQLKQWSEMSEDTRQQIMSDIYQNHNMLTVI